MKGVVAALETARKHDSSEFAMLADVAKDPVRAYPFITDDPAVRSYALLGSWLLPDESTAIGLASVTESTELPLAERLSMSFEVWRSPSEQELAHRLEGLFPTIQPSARLGDRHRDPAEAMLWVGDSGRAGASGGGWKVQIAAIAEARGLTMECAERPTAFQATYGEISRFAGRKVAVWASAAGAFADRASLPMRWRDRAIYLQMPSFGESVEELRLQLDESVAESTTVVETWDHFSERVHELEHSGFVLTGACRQMLIGNPYPDPKRMWGFAETLSRAARDWHDLGGEVGNRLADWIAENYEIEVALHDAALGSWAEFTFEGCNYSREPHVKVDDVKNPRECGRIYFAVDSDALKFIVDYIGLHP